MALKIYDFKCRDCGHVEEVMLNYACADDTLMCPACWGGNMARMPSATRTTFKFADKSGIKRGKAHG
jgi:putative FmdB family regulatory protein